MEVFGRRCDCYAPCGILDCTRIVRQADYGGKRHFGYHYVRGGKCVGRQEYVLVRSAYLPFDFVLANLYRLCFRKNLFDYADYLAHLRDVGLVFDGGNPYLLYRGWLYGYDFTDKSHFVDRSFGGKRFLRKMGKVDVEIAGCGIYYDCIDTFLRRGNRILKI